MTQTLPTLDDMQTIGPWHIGMPYLPLLTDEWLAEHPHPNYTEGWHLFCDIETQTTYIIQTAKHGTLTLYAGNTPLEIHLADTDDYEYEYMPYEQYEAELTTNKAKYINPNIDPWYAMANYKIGYKWLPDGTGYMIGNKYHTYGWWCLDDCLYNNMLFDMADKWHLKNK